MRPDSETLSGSGREAVGLAGPMTDTQATSGKMLAARPHPLKTSPHADASPSAKYHLNSRAPEARATCATPHPRENNGPNEQSKCSRPSVGGDAVALRTLWLTRQAYLRIGERQMRRRLKRQPEVCEILSIFLA